MTGQRAGGAPGQVKEITSLANPLVKDIKALALKKFRDQQNAFMAEGLKLVIDALDLGWSIKTLVFAKSALGNAAVEKVAARTVAAGGTVLEVSEKVLTAITRRDNPQAVVGVFAQTFPAAQGYQPGKRRCLGGARPCARSWQSRHRHPHRRRGRRKGRDPGRRDDRSVFAGDGAGDDGLDLRGSGGAGPRRKRFLPGGRAFRASSPAPISRVRSTTARWIFGNGPVLLLMGNEQQGLPDDLAHSCDRLLRIPQAGRADSLNLAVATGIMLFEIRRGCAQARRGGHALLKSLFALCRPCRGGGRA